MLGCGIDYFYIPLLSVSVAAGLASLGRRAWRGLPLAPPGTAWAAAFLGVVVLQLVPVPPGLLRLISPGSFDYWDVPLIPLRAARPVSVGPDRTLRALGFFGAMMLAYAAFWGEYRDRRWRRRLAAAVALAGLGSALAGLGHRWLGAQSIFALWYVGPSIFAPFMIRTHTAAHLAMALPPALALVGSCLAAAVRRWPARGWRALFDREALGAAHWALVCAAIALALALSQARGGQAAAVLAAAALLLGRGLRWPLWLGAASTLALAGLRLARGLPLVTPRYGEIRIELWRDLAGMVPDFPVLGCGLNALVVISRQYQTGSPWNWVVQAHNEYLQLLCDTGVLGLATALLALRAVGRAAWPQLGEDWVRAGLLAGAFAACANAFVHFLWQVPANGFLFAALLAGASKADGAVPAAAPEQPEA